MGTAQGSVAVARAGTRSSAVTVAGLVIAFGWPVLLWVPAISTHQITSRHDDLVGMALKWIVVAVLAAIAFGVQRYRPSELGLRRFSWVDGLVGFGGFVLTMMLTGIVSQAVRMPSSVTQLGKIGELSLGLRVAVVCSAAVCEEFVFRGFGIEELASLVGNRWVAGALSLLLFAMAHVGLYGLTAALLIPFLAGAVLTALYLWRRNLGACILTHLLVDGLMLVVIPSFIHAK